MPASTSSVATGTTVSAEAVRQPTHTRNNNGVLRTASALVVELVALTNQKIGRAPSRTAHSFSGEEVFRRDSRDSVQLEHAFDRSTQIGRAVFVERRRSESRNAAADRFERS
jgi:hypothetical protein